MMVTGLSTKHIFSLRIASNTLKFSFIDQSLLCSVFQRYNLNAIHNSDCECRHSGVVVLGISKIQSKRNSQQRLTSSIPYMSCARYFKDTI